MLNPHDEHLRVRRRHFGQVLAGQVTRSCARQEVPAHGNTADTPPTRQKPLSALTRPEHRLEEAVEVREVIAHLGEVAEHAVDRVLHGERRL